jgi:hypothetical protein
METSTHLPVANGGCNIFNLQPSSAILDYQEAVTIIDSILKSATISSFGTCILHVGSDNYRYRKIRIYVQGWMNYFSIGRRYNTAVEWDQSFRRRIRMCYWKQWCRTKKRVGELMKRGVGERHAVKAGMSRKSYWHLAKTEAINAGLSNTHLTK